MSGRANTLKNEIAQVPAIEGGMTDALQAGPLASKDDASAAATIFEAFEEVALDLTFSFSPQNSPATSTSEVPVPHFAPTPSPPLARSPLPRASVEAADTLSRSFSFASQLRPFSPLKSAKEKSKLAEFLPLQSSSVRQSSLPAAVSYAGRGTPIDRNRTREWGGFSSGGVSEDGLLFSSEMRATSLDSRLARLSSSSDWDFLNPGPSASGSPLSGRRSVLSHSLAEDEEEGVPPPKIEVKFENGIENWASVMETVLCSAEKEGLNRERPPTIPEEVEEHVVMKEARSERDDGANGNQMPMGKGDELSEVRFDVHIDKALDLGFNPAGDGGPLFNLATANADSENSNLTIGRVATESSLSQYSTPSEGDSDNRPAGALVTTVFPPASKGQVKYEGGSALQAGTNLRDSMSLSPGMKEGSPWWKRGLEKLRRLQVILRARRNMC